MDLEQIADAKLAEMEAADKQADDKSPTPNGGDDGAADDKPAGDAGDDKSKKKGEGDDSQEQADDSGEEKDGQDSGDEAANDKADDDDKKSREPKGDEAQELTNEQLLAELEKRGIKLKEAKEGDDKPAQPQQPADWEKRPTEIPEDVWGGMEPQAKFIYQKLPYITVQGKDGNTLRVKTPEQLPDDFEFANPRAEAQFNSEVTSQSVRAEKMQADIIAHQRQSQQAQQAQETAKQTVADVERLQKEGIVPNFIAKPGTAEFNDDPGVKRANDIIAIRDEVNARGGEQISTYTAGLIYKAQHAEEFAPKPEEKKGSPADAERKQASGKVAGTNRGDQAKAATPRKNWGANTSLTDIADFYAKDLD